MNSIVRARINPEIQASAAAVLEDIGLTVSDVLRMVLTRIAKEKQVPTELFRPNAETIAAMEEATALLKRGKLRFKSIEDTIDAIHGEADEAG